MEKKCCANRSCGSALLLGSAVLFQNMLAEWNQKLLHIIYLNTCMWAGVVFAGQGGPTFTVCMMQLLFHMIWYYIYSLGIDMKLLMSQSLPRYVLIGFDRWQMIYYAQIFPQNNNTIKFLMNHHQYVGLWRPQIASSVQTKTLRLLILMTKQSSKWVKRLIEFIINLLSEHS